MVSLRLSTWSEALGMLAEMVAKAEKKTRKPISGDEIRLQIERQIPYLPRQASPPGKTAGFRMTRVGLGRSLEVTAGRPSGE
jgi:hypothetical protein